MADGMLNEQELEIVKEVAKEVAKDVYADAGKPIMKPAGELVGLIPRAIKAALEPVEKWVLQREYNVAETKKLLEEKLSNTSPELIESPEPYIAVPALQYISYCMDNNELRDMYANLLANSMNKIVKNGVHPGFVEIIKQLSPDEAKVLRHLAVRKVIPTVTLRYENEKRSGIDVIRNFSNVGEIVKCEYPFEISKYLDNMIRLGLVKDSGLSSLTDKSRYDNLKTHPHIQEYLEEETILQTGYNTPVFKEGFMTLTDYGKSFCEICLTPINVITVEIKENIK